MHKLGIGLTLLVHFWGGLPGLQKSQIYKATNSCCIFAVWLILVIRFFQWVGISLQQLLLPLLFAKRFLPMTFCFSTKAKRFFPVSKHYRKNSCWAVIFHFKESFLYIKQLKSWYILPQLAAFVTNIKTLVCALVSCLNYCNTTWFSVKTITSLQKKKKKDSLISWISN